MGFDTETEGNTGLRRFIIGAVILGIVVGLGYMWVQHIAKPVEATNAEIDRSAKQTMRNLRVNIRGRIQRPGVDPDEIINQARQ